MKQLEYLLKEQRKTQKSLALDLKITPQAINNYIKKKTEPDIKTLIKIADYFNVSLDYLCERPFNNGIGYVPEEKKEVVKLILQLNQINTIKALGYVSGLIAGQN